MSYKVRSMYFSNKKLESELEIFLNKKLSLGWKLNIIINYEVITDKTKITFIFNDNNTSKE